MGYANLLRGNPTAAVCNGAFLKLGDTFQRGDNLLRYCACKVMGSTRLQLSRVFNVQRLVKRIHVVFESNDPVARSLAVRAFSSMSELLVSNSRVHSDLRNALSSPNEDEALACVLCVSDFAAASPSFALRSVSLLESFITALETPMDTRVRLIRALRFMHRDRECALHAMSILERAAEQFPADEVVCACLHVQTSLSIRTSLHVEQHAHQLLRYISSDARRNVRHSAAASLETLVRGTVAPCTIPGSALLTIARTSDDHLLKMRAMQLLAATIRSGACSGTAPLRTELLELLQGIQRSAGGSGAGAGGDVVAKIAAVCAAALLTGTDARGGAGGAEMDAGGKALGAVATDVAISSLAALSSLSATDLEVRAPASG